MSPATDGTMNSATQKSPTVPPPSRRRDPRLDFFRGLAMYIILIAHIPRNPWTHWIPARFGFSDATEIFVFCSGMASAIAFGSVFANNGFWLGTTRVLFRCWQVYWAHIALFFFIAMYLAAIDTFGSFEKSYINTLNLTPFFRDPIPNIVGLFSLTYVPNYFDILPMYLVILAMMPLFVAIANRSFLLAAAIAILVWFAANLGYVPLPAEPWSEREWFFNPFGWQLLFFTGFAFMKGWLPTPPISKLLIVLAIAFVVLSAPFGSWKVFSWTNALFPEFGDLIRPAWGEVRDYRTKTELGILRYVHFLALAYLAWIAVGPRGSRLLPKEQGVLAFIWKIILHCISKVGQQSLAIFVFSMALARLIGFVFDLLGREPQIVLLGNLIGFVLIIFVAHVTAWFKATPWRNRS